MWPDAMDEILGGDQAVALAHVTPAKGVVLAPVTNFALRDRASGTVTVNSSVGMWRKLERIRQNPHVAVAFHTRAHAIADRPEYVLVQGSASLSSLEDRDVMVWPDLACAGSPKVYGGPATGRATATPTGSGRRDRSAHRPLAGGQQS